MDGKKRMRVLFSVSANRDTGIYVHAKSLAEALRKKGVEVEIDKLKGHYDLIHFQNPLPTSFLRIKRHYPLVPMVCTTNMTQAELMGIVPKAIMPLAENYLYLFYFSCKKIICSSPKIMEELKKIPFISERTVYIPNGVDLQRTRKDNNAAERFSKIAKGRKIVLCVATIQKRKGFFDFVKVAKRMKEYCFVWVGGVPNLPTLESKEEIEKIIREKHGNIIFTGFLDAEKLNAAYSAADVFLFPTHAETFGLVAVEAASCGLPVIMRDIPEFEMFSSFGIKFRNNYEAEQEIRRILGSRKEWEKYSRRGIRAASEFDLGKYAEKIMGLYGKII